MDNQQNDKSDLPDNLLLLSPESLLRTLPNDMRRPLGSLLAALDMLEEEPLSEEEHDEMLKIAQRSAHTIDNMLKLILRYFEARDAMNNTDSQPSE
ncbi:MAG: hypothetical protein GC179_09275 [Anaerolineaceae bacterium]|nr:hypothetical protein [Anaerolineaceae bacterium]